MSDDSKKYNTGEVVKIITSDGEEYAILGKNKYGQFNLKYEEGYTISPIDINMLTRRKDGQLVYNSQYAGKRRRTRRTKRPQKKRRGTRRKRRV